MTSTQDWDIIIIPHYLFLQNGQAKDFVHGEESFKTQMETQLNFCCISCLHETVPWSSINSRNQSKNYIKYLKKICGKFIFTTVIAYSLLLYQKLAPSQIDFNNSAKFYESPFLQSIFKWLLPIFRKTDFLPCQSVYITDSEHVNGDSNITVLITLL